MQARPSVDLCIGTGVQMAQHVPLFNSQRPSIAQGGSVVSALNVSSLGDVDCHSASVGIQDQSCRTLNAHIGPDSTLSQTQVNSIRPVLTTAVWFALIDLSPYTFGCMLSGSLYL